MIYKKLTARFEARPNMRGGAGTVDCYHVFPQEELQAGTTLFARLVFDPGDSIGEHAHLENVEYFYLLSGELELSADDERCLLQAGDAMVCTDGHRHSVRNLSQEPAELLAVIVAKA